MAQWMAQADVYLFTSGAECRVYGITRSFFFPEQTPGYSIAGYIFAVVQSLGEAFATDVLTLTCVGFVPTKDFVFCFLFFWGGGGLFVSFKFALVSLYYKWGNGNHYAFGCIINYTC